MLCVLLVTVTNIWKLSWPRRLQSIFVTFGFTIFTFLRGNQHFLSSKLFSSGLFLYLCHLKVIYCLMQGHMQRASPFVVFLRHISCCDTETVFMGRIVYATNMITSTGINGNKDAFSDLLFQRGQLWDSQQ